MTFGLSRAEQVGSRLVLGSRAVLVGACLSWANELSLSSVVVQQAQAVEVLKALNTFGRFVAGLGSCDVVYNTKLH